MAQSYVERLASKHRSPRTINLTTTSLRIFFDFLVLRGEAEVNPFAAPFYDIHHTRTPPSDTHTLTDDDIRILLGAPLWHWQKDAGQAMSHFRRARDFSDYKAKRDEAMIRLIFFAGLKTGEVASLLEEHFDRESSMLSVSSASKSRRVFLVPVAASAFAQSLDLKASLFPGGSHAFVNRFGKKLTERSVYRLVAKYASDCDVAADVSPADLRRAFERRLIMVETEEWLIQYLLGFEEYSFSEELVEAMRSALEKISERIGVSA
jgi:integrase/recombinase XerC